MGYNNDVRNMNRGKEIRKSKEEIIKRIFMESVDGEKKE